MSEIRDRINNTTKRKKRNRAILAEPLAIPVNPKSPAIKATIKNMIVHVSILIWFS